MNTLNSPDKGWSPNIEQEILQVVKSLRYGSMEIIIHDSKVVQIERKEKIRLDKNGSDKGR
jgi:hypothetical protein